MIIYNLQIYQLNIWPTSKSFTGLSNVEKLPHFTI